MAGGVALLDGPLDSTPLEPLLIGAELPDSLLGCFFWRDIFPPFGACRGVTAPKQRSAILHRSQKRCFRSSQAANQRKAESR